jgi:AcrR family transcriptional regulator
VPRPYSMARRALLTAATRERVLRAALELIVALGPDAMTLQAVAERADVAPGTIYYHFSSRDQLLAAAYDMLRVEWEQREAWATSETAPAAQLRALIRSLCQDYEGQRALLSVILHIRGSEELAEAIARVRHVRRTVLTSILEHAQRLGLLRLPLPRAVALAYTLTSFASWQNLVEEMGLAPSEVPGELSEMLLAALFRSC